MFCCRKSFIGEGAICNLTFIANWTEVDLINTILLIQNQHFMICIYIWCCQAIRKYILIKVNIYIHLKKSIFVKLPNDILIRQQYFKIFFQQVNFKGIHLIFLIPNCDRNVWILTPVIHFYLPVAMQTTRTKNPIIVAVECG